MFELPSSSTKIDKILIDKNIVKNRENPLKLISKKAAN